MDDVMVVLAPLDRTWPGGGRLIGGCMSIQCCGRLQQHLLSNDHFTVDGTLLESWGSLKSFQPKPNLGGQRKPKRGRRGGGPTRRQRRRSQPVGLACPASLMSAVTSAGACSVASAALSEDQSGLRQVRDRRGV